MPSAVNPENLTPILDAALRRGDWWSYWKHPHGPAVAGVGVRERFGAADGWTDIPDDRRGFLSVAFDGVHAPHWSGFPAVEVVVPYEVFVGALPTDAEPNGRYEVGPGDYPERVESALRSIDAGLVEKIVIAREEVVEVADPVRTLAALQAAFPTCYVFAVCNGESVFLGATPERLVEIGGGVVETSALAGTSKPGDDGLLESDKDLREHRWVIDAIEEALGPLCESLEIPNRPELLELPNVQHLHTPIRGILSDGRDWREVAQRLHPTPAVCGEPRDEAKRLVRELEGFDRGLYAGVVGWVNGRDAELAVALRSALLTPTESRLYAGAGIVTGSDPHAEHEETVSKLQAVARWLRYR